MRLGNLLFIICIFPSFTFAANFSCEITEALAKAAAKPELASNPDFWKGLAKIPAGNDLAAAEYLKKFGIQSLVTSRETATTAVSLLKSSSAAVSTTQSVEFTGRAEKAVRSLQPYLREKLDTFIKTVAESGVSSLRSTQSSWQLERMSHLGNVYTVRLNHGYRVAFESSENGAIKILDVSKQIGHGTSKSDQYLNKF